MTDMLATALRIAFTAHHGQVDKDGIDYIRHPLYVALKCNTLDEKVVALLHDVVEDSAITLNDLKEAGFPQNILDAVKLLTKTHATPYQHYLQNIASNKLATTVKFADMAHNAGRGNDPANTAKYKDRIKTLQYYVAQH